MKYRDALREWKRAYFCAMLVEHNWKVARVARAAAISRTSLYRTLAGVGLYKPELALREKQARGNQAWQALGKMSAD